MRVTEESEKAGLKLSIQKTKIMASGPITLWQIEREKVEAVTGFIFLGSKITADDDCSHEIKTLGPLKKSHGKPWQHIKNQRYHFVDKDRHSQIYDFFSSSHIWMWELDPKEGLELKNLYFQTMVLEKTLESPLDCKELKSVNPKGNQPCVFIGRTHAEAEAPILWPPDGKTQLIGKYPNAGKDWRQEQKGTPEDEMDGWQYQLNGHEFKQTLG